MAPFRDVVVAALFWTSMARARLAVTGDLRQQSPQEEALEAALPMKWLHVPRSGTSFINVLTHHPGICPDFPQELIVVRGNVPEDVQDLLTANSSIRTAAARSPLWNHSSYKSVCHGRLLPAGHRSIGGKWSLYKDKTVLMMRQPEQRLLSAYDIGKLGCPKCENETDFAQTVAGCVTKMMVRSSDPGNSPCLRPTDPPTEKEVKVAAHRLLHQTAFVGIVEEWALSICLFHAMFGGQCSNVETLNVHPGKPRTAGYDTARLGGYTDPYDGHLYDAARKLFSARLQEYGVTRDKCNNVCS